MERISVEDFEEKIDSLYRLVIVAARRANQVSKPENRPLVPVHSKKATIVALEEILQDKVGYTTELTDDENLFE